MKRFLIGLAVGIFLGLPPGFALRRVFFADSHRGGRRERGGFGARERKIVARGRVSPRFGGQRFRALGRGKNYAFARGGRSALFDFGG